MAKLGFQYEVDVEATDKQFTGGGILPHMNTSVWAESIEFKDTPDGKGKIANIAFEVQEPEQYKGRKFWENWTILHPDTYSLPAYKYGKPQFDKFARAVGVHVTADTDTDELIFKTFVIKTSLNKGKIKDAATGEFWSDKVQIGEFYFDDSRARELGRTVPELGLIGDGAYPEQAARTTPKAANSNVAARPATSAASTTGKKNPWDKPAAA